MTKSYIYPIANRLTHGAMILSLPLCYVLGDFNQLFYYHGVLGMVFFYAVVFRILWGMFGSKHSRFSDFHFKGLKEYLLCVFGEKKSYIAHNPASSIAIVLMLVLGVLTCLSGLVLWGEKEGGGIFSSLYFSYHSLNSFAKLHELFANSLLIVVGVHICGALIDRIIHKNDSLQAIIGGYKTTPTQESITLTPTQKLFCAFYGVFALFLTLYTLYPKNLLLGFTTPSPLIAHTSSQALYQKECGSCHIAYAPYLLPKEAWGKMMSDLENHFGDDASVESDTQKELAQFLEDNSQRDTYIADRLSKERGDYLAFSQTQLFAKIHKKIPQKVFKSKEIKSRANCQSCHKDAERGYFQKSRIDFSKLNALKS
ncbi:cytochrome b/b6 domain-containing protein [Helicobacter brantae]|nr:cytochrome b/b6 domain-containing protein [Helicobacter brantae]